MSKSITRDKYGQFVKNKDIEDKGTLTDPKKSINNHSAKLVEHTNSSSSEGEEDTKLEISNMERENDELFSIF